MKRNLQQGSATPATVRISRVVARLLPLRNHDNFKKVCTKPPYRETREPLGNVVH